MYPSSTLAPWHLCLRITWLIAHTLRITPAQKQKQKAKSKSRKQRLLISELLPDGQANLLASGVKWAEGICLSMA